MTQLDMWLPVQGAPACFGLVRIGNPTSFAPWTTERRQQYRTALEGQMEAMKQELEALKAEEENA